MGYNYYLLKPSPLTLSKGYDIQADELDLFIHVGKVYHGSFIWAIKERQLDEYYESGLFTLYGEEGRPQNWERLWIDLSRNICWDYSQVGKKFC